MSLSLPTSLPFSGLVSLFSHGSLSPTIQFAMSHCGPWTAMKGKLGSDVASAL